MKFIAPVVRKKVFVRSTDDSDDEKDDRKTFTKEPVERGIKRPHDGSEPQNKKKYQPSYDELAETRASLAEETKNLPIYVLRKKLIKKVKEVKSLIIVGETGSGKTTQVPKFLFQANVNRNNCMAITQPRRIAATSLATRVAAEIGCQLGTKVGYHVRFSKMARDDHESSLIDDDTKILFLTDGMLLRESLLDPLLKKYTVIILDEAHERTVETDVLFGVVKAAQKKREEHNRLSPLKVLVMSATMDVDKFKNYFDADVFEIPGRTHKIDMFYEDIKVKDYVDGCLERVININKTAPASDHVLVFLTGKDEIEAAVKVLNRKASGQSSSLPPLVVYPFYSALPQDLQEKVFQPVPEGCRKVILSTNLAETSLTISGIKYVVDSGVSKVKTYDPNRGLDRLRVEPISKAQANQRSGRAGREGPGICYRVYTKKTFDSFNVVSVPEIQRRSLASVILQLMFMGIKDIANFDFVDKPSEKTIIEAYKTLKHLKAVDGEDNLELTADGKLMASLPLDPKYGKIIMTASQYGCLHEVLIIISVLSSEDPFVDDPKNRKQNREKIEGLIDISGDLLTFLNLFREFKKQSATNRQEWCHKNFLNYRSLTFSMSVKDQLKEICNNNGMKYSTCNGDETTRERVLKSFCSGLYNNVAKRSIDRYYLMNSNSEVFIHPSSVLYKYRKEYILFCELIDTSEIYMRIASEIDFRWIKDFAPEGFLKIPFSSTSEKDIRKRKLENEQRIHGVYRKKK